MEIKCSDITDASPDKVGGFTGKLKDVYLVDLIQMFCLSASSLCLQVENADQAGSIVFVEGEIVHAVCQGLVGEAAFYHMLGWQTGRFETDSVSKPFEKTISQNYNMLIMEAARRFDEKYKSESKLASETCDADASNDQARMRVLIVDDSPMMRKILANLLTSRDWVKVVGMAGDGREAIALIDELSPDLVILDVNMPVMDGTSTIKHIMIKKPCPVVIMSSPGEGAFRSIFKFLELGAVDFMSKPTRSQDILVQQEKIHERIRLAATARVENFRIVRLSKSEYVAPPELPCRSLVVVISGAGGFSDQIGLLSGLIPSLDSMAAAVVALESLPPTFSTAFAEYLQNRLGIHATSIDRRTPLLVRRTYVGIVGCPLSVNSGDDAFVIEPDPFLPEDQRVPVDHFLSRAAEIFKDRLTIVLLSGAYAGDQSGLQAVKNSGGRIILRKRESSMVSEPLDRVVESGLADVEVIPDDLVKTVVKTGNDTAL